jgi:hypothetical protein
MDPLHWKWTREGDVFVVDRGFKDSVDFLNELGITTEMPAFLDKGQKQLTTEQSNTSRLVTKIRWVVQSANGRLKSWKYFDKVLPNSRPSPAFTIPRDDITFIIQNS